MRRMRWRESGAGPGRAARRAILYNTRVRNDVRDELFLAVGHDMDTGHAFDLADLLDQLDADLLAFELLVLRPFDAVDDRIGDVDARHIGAHPARTAGGGERSDAHQDEAFLVQPLL